MRAASIARILNRTWEAVHTRSHRANPQRAVRLRSVFLPARTTQLGEPRRKTRVRDARLFLPCLRFVALTRQLRWSTRCAPPGPDLEVHKKLEGRSCDFARGWAISHVTAESTRLCLHSLARSTPGRAILSLLRTIHMHPISTSFRLMDVPAGVIQVLRSDHGSDIACSEEGGSCSSGIEKKHRALLFPATRPPHRWRSTTPPASRRVRQTCSPTADSSPSILKMQSPRPSPTRPKRSSEFCAKVNRPSK